MKKVANLESADLYQIKISLNGVKPPIWRRIIVDSMIKLPDLHKIIQSSMGWTNSHLNQFIKDNKFYSLPSDDDFEDNIDYRNIRLSSLLLNPKEKITYEYDFGDGWEHTVLLENIIKKDEIERYPVCIAGKRNCPPEDCGGIWGYQDLLEIITDKNNDGHEEMLEWLGGEFDPEYFDINEINELLHKKDFGCIEIYD